jgi:ABC-type molybdate transport system substrate-binding protein
MKKSRSHLTRRAILSIGIILAALGLSYAPLPGVQQQIVVVSGTELREPLTALEEKFERSHPNIQLELKFQGSQDIVNRYIDDRNDFKPTVVIPANGEILRELETRWRSQNGTDPFYEKPQPIAKTMLVGIAWAERGKVLFPDGRFSWERVEKAMQAGDWGTIGGSKDWGSFDFVATDPTRSNSGFLTLSLWAQSKLGGSLSPGGLSNPAVQSLFGLVKRSIYQPPQSTDVLLQDFIARGSNDADVATVYESIALHRWNQSTATQGQPYQIYYLNPTIETVSTAAIVRRDVSDSAARASKQLIDFLSQPEQQAVFVQHGFRPINTSVDLKTVPNSPWTQNIPGAETNPNIQIANTPDTQILTEINRLWERAD